MGRKSKLTAAQWAEVDRRLLEGEAARAIARDLGVSEGIIRARKNTHTEPVKNVANQIVSSHVALRSLPIAAQISAQTLAHKLISISDNLASAAMHGAATAHRLSALANAEVAKVDDAQPLNMEAMKGVAALTKLANDSSSIALNLLAANKDAVARINAPEAEQLNLTVGFVDVAALDV